VISVEGLGECFADGRFTLADACPLPRPGVVLDIGVTTLNAAGSDITAGITAPVRTTLRTGLAPLTAADSCAEEATYTGSVTAGPQSSEINTTLPPEEGFYVWCVAPQTGADPSDGGPVRAVLERDLTPPVRTPRLSVDSSELGYRVQPVFSPPELSDFRIKSGPETSTDCADAAGYRPFLRVPAFVPAGRLPATFCYIGADLAGNQTPPYSRRLG
jgi:hypothetical protein